MEMLIITLIIILRILIHGVFMEPDAVRHFTERFHLTLHERHGESGVQGRAISLFKDRNTVMVELE
jgi:hypothetical protein